VAIAATMRSTKYRKENRFIILKSATQNRVPLAQRVKLYQTMIHFLKMTCRMPSTRISAVLGDYHFTRNPTKKNMIFIKFYSIEYRSFIHLSSLHYSISKQMNIPESINNCWVALVPVLAGILFNQWFEPQGKPWTLFRSKLRGIKPLKVD
jgi:hypothetical protein